MNDARAGLAILTATIAFAVGAYVALAKVLVGGVVQFVEGIKADPADGGDIAVGLVRVWLLWEPTWAAIFGVGLGIAFIIWPGDRPHPSPRGRKPGSAF